MTVKDIDHGFDRINAGLQLLAKKKISVGYMPPTSQEVISRAAFAELGTANQEARPFMRSAVDAQPAELGGELAVAVAALIDGVVDADGAADNMGRAIKTAIERRIDDSRSWAEPLFLETVLRKGHDQPLVDTEEMRDSLTVKVEATI